MHETISPQPPRRSRKPWHGRAGHPFGPRQTLEQFLDDVYKARAYLQTYDRFRLDVKQATYSRISKSKPKFNEYLAHGGVPWPLPPDDHLVFVCDVGTRTVRWVSDSVCSTIRLPREALVGTPMCVSLRDNEDMRVTDPVFFEQTALLLNGQQDEVIVDTYLVRADHWHVPVSLHITYGAFFEVFFIDGIVTGEIYLVLPPTNLKEAIPDQLINELGYIPDQLINEHDSQTNDRFNVVGDTVISPIWATPARTYVRAASAEEFISVVRRNLVAKYPLHEHLPDKRV